MNKRIVIYTKPDCSYCVDAKSVLKNNNIPFEEKTLNLDFTREYLLEEYQFKIERVQISDFFQIIKSKNYSKNFIDADVLLFSSMWFQDDLAIIQDLISALKVFKKKVIITTNTPEFSVKKIKFKNDSKHKNF